MTTRATNNEQAVTRDHAAQPASRDHAAQPASRDHAAQPASRDHAAQPASRGPGAQVTSRRKLLLFGAAALVVPGVAFAALYRPYPSDRTPEGAYVRLAFAVSRSDPSGFFAYLEEEARWACYTIRDMRLRTRDKVLASYPEPQRTELASTYAPFAEAPDGADVFALLYRTRGWERRLRKDMSGVASVDMDDKKERASVVTARGTRWPFRRRDNGIWGLMAFTAELVAEAEKATRDLAVVEAAAADYDKLRAAR